MGLILQHPYILRSNPLNGTLKAYYLPYLSSGSDSCLESSLYSHPYSCPTAIFPCPSHGTSLPVFKLIQAGPSMSGQPAIFDAMTLDPWHPASRTGIIHFVMAALDVKNYVSWSLEVYEWDAASSGSLLSEPFDPSDFLISNADRSASTTFPPGSTSNPSTTPSGPSSTSLIAKMSIPSVEHLHDIHIHHVEHPSLAFLAICPVDVEKGMFEVRVARRDGRVEENTVKMCLGLVWSARDRLLISPSVGRLIAVTERSFIVFDL